MRIIQQFDPRFLKFWLTSILCLSLIGCEPFANPYSAEAFRQATSLKAKSLALIDKGTEPFSSNSENAERVLIEIAEAYEFARARGRKASDEAAKQWEIILDPHGGSVGDFVEQWRKKGSFSEFFIAEFSSVVAQQFDRIIELETGRTIKSE